MDKIKVIIVYHHHIPFGSSDSEFEYYYIHTLKPLVTSLYKAPHFVVVMHCSGILLEWLEKKHPELLMLFEELINRKQIELLGGGFYEPLLSFIPLTDKIGQIELLTTYIRKHFGKRPRGCWIPGLYWDQNFAAILNTCGIDYSFVRHTQFVAAGMDEQSLSQAFLTEDQGKLTTLFPIRSCATSEEALAFLAKCKSSAEKQEPKEQLISLLVNQSHIQIEGDEHFDTDFGRLISYFQAESATFELTLPLKYVKQDLSLTKIYLKGENLRQSLVEHPEANDIYSKMIYVHTLINQLRGDKARKKNAREQLWKAQGIDVFYSEVLQGIQKNRLRKAMYSSLIEAEKITREKGVFIPSILTFDFNLDRKTEFVMQGYEINCYISHRGGAVFELDYIPAATNYVDTFQSHEGDSVPGTKKRTSFVENLCPPGSSLHEIISDSQHRNRFCGNELYKEDPSNRSQNSISFILDVNPTEPFGQIRIIKQYSLKKNSLILLYTLQNMGTHTERFSFLPQIDLSFLEFSTNYYQLFVLQGGQNKELDLDIRDLKNVERVSFKDCKNDIIISLASDIPYDAWQFPVFSPVSIYQSTCVMPIQEVLLTPGEQWKTGFQLLFEKD